MGKSNHITVNGVPQNVPYNTTAGSLKEILQADPADWVFAKPPDGVHYRIPDDDVLPEGISDFAIIPQFEYGAVRAPVRPDWELCQRLSRLTAEAAFLERNRNYGKVEYDDKGATWFSVASLPIGREWSVSTVSILINIPSGTPGYPHLPPSWFWTDKDLKTSDGRDLAHFFPADGKSEYADKGWGHFCLKMKTWQPRTDIFFAQGHSLISFLEALEVAFHERPRVRG
jgi:hypothetical protein